MEKYKVYWKDTLIGELYVEDGKHKYEPNYENVSKLNEVPLDPILLNSRDFGEKIPFFQTRLESAEKFSDLPIGFQTDFYRLKKY